MRLYLVRHGKAEESGSGVSDAARRLSAKGRDDIDRLARRLKEIGIGWRMIQSSPLVRARETAEILCAAALAPVLEETELLAPAGELPAMLATLVAWRNEDTGDVALVGHLPNLVDWAEELMWGEARGRLTLKPGGVIGLELPTSGSLRGGCDLFYLVSPRLMP